MSSALRMMLSVFVSLVLASIVHAQQGDVSSQKSASSSFPRLVRFIGTLPERRGASPAAAASARVTFAIYEEQAGGAALWSEVQDIRHDAQGRYSVLLGAASRDGLPAELFSTAGARWLGVQVEGRQEEPRILLVAVPYALKAADADTLGGKPATAFVASDQLKEQVQSEVKAQVTESGSTTRTLVGTSPTPQVIAETSPATFTCATSGICVQSTQSGAGGIALRGTTGSATGTGAIFDNLGGGKILSGRTTGYAEKFYVDGGGNLWAGSSLTANSYAGTSGAAVFGVVTATTGAAYGVRGQSASVSGVGVFGYGTSPTGLTYGVLGSNLSASGTGLSGSASSPTGVTIGVRAVVQSPNGTAAIFDNLGGGKLISARTTGYAEKFSVDGTGSAFFSGTVTASSSSTYGIDATSSSPTGTGVHGTSNSSTGVGVAGVNTAGGVGVIGAGHPGVRGVANSSGAVGILGVQNVGNFAGLFTGNVNINGTVGPVTPAALTANGIGTGSIGVQGTSNDVNGVAGIFTNTAGGKILVAEDGSNTLFKVDSNGQHMEAPIVVDFSNDPTTGTVLNELVKLTPTGDGVVTSAGDVGGAVGVVVSGAGTSGDAIFALFGPVGCVFDNTAVLGDYVTISATANGECHDSGAAYPPNVQMLGRVIEPGSSPPGIYLSGPEFRAGTGTLSTLTNCSSSASPSVCGSSSTGSVALASGNTTLVIDTTAVGANSQIMLQEDSSLGSKLGVTCNITAGRTYMVSSRSAGTSFTITANSAPTTNPACVSYVIVN